MRRERGRWVNAVRRRYMLGIAVLVGTLLPVFFAGVSGNLSIPHNDGWAYSRIAQTFAITGRIELLGWNRSALVGQFVPLGPLGKSVLAQQAFVAGLSVLLLVAVHELILPRLGRRPAGLITIAVALWPGYALLSTSFMADVPMMAFAFAALWAADVAMQRDLRWVFVAAMLLGLWACTIRLQGIAAPAAITLTFLLQHRQLRRVRPWLVVVTTGVLLAVFATFTVWHAGLPRNDAASFALHEAPFQSLWTGAAQGYFELALVAAPVVLLLSRPSQWRWRSLFVGIATTALGFVLLAQEHVAGFFLPNYLSQMGAYGIIMTPGTPVYSNTQWGAVVVAAIVAGGVLAAALAAPRRRRLQMPLLTTFTLLTIVGTLGTLVTVQSVFGRYLIAVLPWMLALAIRSPSREDDARLSRALRVPRVAAAYVAFGSVAVLSASLMLHAFAYDRARWNAAEYTVREGVPANLIDAGFEWDGWHSDHGVIRPKPTFGWGRESMFSDQLSCVVLTKLAPDELQRYGLTSWTLRRVVGYRTWLIAGQARIYSYDAHSAGCA